MGISKIKRLGISLLEGVIWEELSEKRRGKIERKTCRLGSEHLAMYPAGMSLKSKLKFLMCKVMHKALLKKESPPSADNQHWIDRGWLKRSERKER
jgi:hypothetical protein